MCWLTAGWLAGWGRKEEERAGGLWPGSLSVGSCLASKAACCLWSRFQGMNLWSRVWDQNDSKRGADRREGDGRIDLSIFSSSSRIMETGEPLAGGSLLPISWLQVSRLTKVHIIGPQSCRVTSAADLHINMFATAPCTLKREGCSLMQNAVWSLIHYGLHYTESRCSKLLLEATSGHFQRGASKRKKKSRLKSGCSSGPSSYLLISNLKVCQYCTFKVHFSKMDIVVDLFFIQ